MLVAIYFLYLLPVLIFLHRMLVTVILEIESHPRLKQR